jgi:hypothetical protein
MTTRRTFEKVAAVLAGERALMGALADEHASRTAVQAINNVTLSVADAFAQDNPRFDRARFYAAAGIPTTQEV